MNDDVIDWTKFVCSLNGTAVIVPCVSFVAFFDLTDDSEILDFYERCREALGERLTHYQAESMKGCSPLNARADAMVRTWFKQPRPGKLNYFMQMDGGDPDQGVSASRLELHVYRRPAGEWTAEVAARELGKRRKAFDAGRFVPPQIASKLRVTLPCDHPLAAPEPFRRWALGFACVRTGNLASAYGGYAVNFYGQAARSSLYGPTQPLLASLCQRHPGFDWDGGGLLPKMLRFRPSPEEFLPLIKRVSWLNLLCDKTVAALGGRDAVRAALSGAESVTDLPRGLCVAAGSSPQVGDVGHRDFVPAYRRVARALRPVRIDEIDGLGAGFMARATNEWLDAFDKTYD